MLTGLCGSCLVRRRCGGRLGGLRVMEFGEII